jgi:hypothetical protein
MIRIASAMMMLFTTLLGGALSVGLPAVTNLPDDVRASLKDARRFQIRVSVSSIPSAVRSSFAKARREEPFAMAEPDATWQAVDIIRNPELPRRRLGKLALSESFCILFYELGGRARSYHVVVFRLAPNGTRLVWRAVLDEAITDPAALMRAIDDGKVDDDPRNGF